MVCTDREVDLDVGGLHDTIHHEVPVAGHILQGVGGDGVAVRVGCRERRRRRDALAMCCSVVFDAVTTGAWSVA